MQRPIHMELIRYACDDVVALLQSYQVLVEELAAIKSAKIQDVIDKTQNIKVNYCLLNTGLELNELCVYHGAIIDGLVKCIKAERGFVFVALNLGVQGRVTDNNNILMNCTGLNPRYREGDSVKFQIASESISYSLGSIIELKFWNERI